MKQYLLTLFAVSVVAALRPLTSTDLATLDKPGAPVASPDGQWAVFTKSNYSSVENKSTGNLWLLNLKNDRITALTNPSKFGDSEPLWLDSATVGFVSSRTETSQLWAINIKPGAQPVQVTNFTRDIGNVKYNTKAKLLAFSTSVYPDGSMEKAVELDAANEKRTDSAMVYEELLFRHWDHWTSVKKQNIFTTKIQKNGEKYTVSKAINVMPGGKLESPTDPFGDSSDYDISPDGKEIAFLSKRPGRDEAWETDINVYVVPTDGSKPPKSLTDKNLGSTFTPAYSSDGKTLAWSQMETRAFEADRKKIILHDRKTKKDRYLNENWDRSPNSLIWSSDSKTIFLPTEDKGHVKIFNADVRTGHIKPITHKHRVGAISQVDKNTLLLTRSSLDHPTEYFTIKTDGTQLKQRTNIHAAKIKDFELTKPEEFWFKGAEGARVHGFILKPINFDPKKKYPVAFMIHGGPQQAWLDSWGSGWNAAIYTNAGYVTVAINPRGSTGYGQKFTNEISKHWGTRPYQDLMKGLDHVLKQYSYADGNRVCALGGSFGGYMVNWINGQTDRFKCLINHDGIFSTESTYYTTEELWFPEYEFGGAPYEKKAGKLYKQFSPSNYVTKWKTPMLIFHGQRDYRLVDGEAFGTFTALRRQGVPARLVYFPDENHWILRPGNSIRWYNEAVNWMNKWTNNTKY
ncbi:S9C family peptidase [Basidiobolus meristosporus CBS 931.73]|uniref:Dipeptidyl-peptidase V n=1 Tax=Basidiobolus meristosporus CBS 931.73 TaxID=1314790 RepID=A0A1Y1X0L3_9FUNG|nr:S9C family peptidase [Basidiobolus meristosporus CBS 931.73]|eukprot:ORX79351.1 S9C family peptidase [Basidiobolus meristosporus CBS 931.73]